MTSLHLAQGSRQPQPSKNRLILYGNRLCPYAQRVRLILDAKKLQYDIININLANKPDWYFDISPMGKVPALQLENGDVLYESLIITDYLDEKYPQNTLLPKDPLQKAKDKLFLYNFNKVIGNMYGLIMNSSKGCFDDQDVVIMEGLASIQTELRNRKGGQFFGGARPGMLDYMIWPWCERADVLKLFGRQFSLKKDKYETLLEWRERMNEDQAVKKSVLTTDVHVRFLQSYRAGIPEYDLIF